ncbi:hypothetical protein [Dinghuibacter silviterrae]|uniref:Uncharacterized protein n=1 Tax=Dinghuibacter silviterrae TaxID=1539049 RepID=A0A4R8DFF6_9BACT|nr:hypothetical protein [Dinghuibacter silviterrae]TDW96195.1 hypothetical protein EDB95_4019 [Dinghuibacter silviterrae]
MKHLLTLLCLVILGGLSSFKAVADNITFTVSINSPYDKHGSVELVNQDTFADNTYYFAEGSSGFQVTIPTGNYDVLVDVNNTANDGLFSVTFNGTTQSADWPGEFFCSWDNVQITDAQNTWLSIAD